jgi:hypothetical protein
MTNMSGPDFHGGERGLRAPGRSKGPPGRKPGRKGRGGHPRGSRGPEPLIKQPVAESTGLVPCTICRCPVDPKRLHIHMVRFHGAALHAPRGSS